MSPPSKSGPHTWVPLGKKPQQANPNPGTEGPSIRPPGTTPPPSHSWIPLPKGLGTSAYPDLATNLMRHAWVVLLYAVACIVIVYLLGVWGNRFALFFAAELPMLLVTAAVLRPNDSLRIRVPWNWILTATIALAYADAVRPEPYSWSCEVVAIATSVLILYWFIRAILGSSVELRHRGQSSFAEGIAGVISVWGATLQIAVLASLAMKPFLMPVLASSVSGKPLLAALRQLKLFSPWSWFPVGLLFLGLGLYASLRFQSDPYTPKNFGEVLKVKLPELLDLLFNALRLPTWVMVVIFGFLVHFVKQLWLSFRQFIEYWMGRFVLILCALVAPTALIMAAHFSVIAVSAQIEAYLPNPPADLSATVVTVLQVHALILLSLCLYIVSTIPLALPIEPVSITKVSQMIRSFSRSDGYPAANAVGRAYSLFGLLIIAVPIASLVPGAPRIGAFALAYFALMAAAFAWYLYKR